MDEVTPAPIDGEYLWDEIGQRWLPLIKSVTGHPDVDGTIKMADDEPMSE